MRILAAIPVICCLALACGSDPQAPAGQTACWNVSEYTTLTAESHRIVLTRWSPCSGAAESAPLLLCPGFPLNVASYRYAAEFLAGSGVDVWAVDYWGRGKSQALPDERETVSRRSNDELIHTDVPAALDLVRSVTGTEEVFLGGISQGGMIALAVMEFHPEKIRGGIVMAPTILVGSISPLLELVWEFPILNVLMPTNHLVRQDTILPMESIVEGLVTLIPPADRETILLSDPAGFLYNPHNVDVGPVEDLLLEGISDVAFNEWIQMWRGAGILLSNGVRSFPGSEFYRTHGEVNYASEVRRIEKPCLLTLGEADQIAPPEKVEAIHARMERCADKTLLRLGRRSGCRCDYGHVDQMLGSRAQEEVLRPLLQWLRSHT